MRLRLRAIRIIRTLAAAVGSFCVAIAVPLAAVPPPAGAVPPVAVPPPAGAVPPVAVPPAVAPVAVPPAVAVAAMHASLEAPVPRRAAPSRHGGTLGPDYVWPVTGPIVNRFDPPERPWLPGHRGVDLAAPQSSPVRAAAAGVVWFAGQVANRPVVSVAHPNGTRTTYEPVEPVVQAGQEVAAGDIIGMLSAGHSGCQQPCLHWGLRHGEVYLDPLILLGLARVRLLPGPLHQPG